MTDFKNPDPNAHPATACTPTVITTTPTIIGTGLTLAPIGDPSPEGVSAAPVWEASERSGPNVLITEPLRQSVLRLSLRACSDGSVRARDRADIGTVDRELDRQR